MALANAVLNPLPLVVQKFGGTSVGTIEKIRQVALLVAESARTQQNVVVVSAMAGHTNRLVEMSYEMSSKPNPEAYDMLLASGEQVTCALLSIALHDLGLKSVPMNAFQAGIESDHLFTNARIKKINPEPLKRIIDSGAVPIIAGFQGITTLEDETPRLTTLGRGGSDTSAVAVAIALQAKRCDIFTDVDGVYTADPRIVPNAKKINEVTLDEMMELASLGAKVLHMRCVELASKYKMPLRVLSTFEKKGTGTMLVENMSIESPVVSAITCDGSESLLTLELPEAQAMFPAKIFRPLADAGINVDVIAKTPANEKQISTMSFTVPRLDVEKTKSLLSAFTLKVSPESIVKLSIVGIGMRTHSGVAASMFESLEEKKIPIKLITTSEIKVSVLIEEKFKELAIKTLHERFIRA